MMPVPLTASLQRDEVALRFPYDEDLRRLLRAIPGRRWDPVARAWLLPAQPEQLLAIGVLLDGPHVRADVSAELAVRIARARARRRRPAELLVDVARPDEQRWLTFALDAPPAAVAALLAHPGARRLDAIARGLVPADAGAERALAGVAEAGVAVALSGAARALLEALAAPAADENPARVRLRRDRRGAHWIVLGPELAGAARALLVGVALREAADGWLGLRADERHADDVAALIEELGPVAIEERVRAWLRRAREWRGSVELAADAQDPELLLLGDARRLPSVLRALAREVPEGAAVPLRADVWGHVRALGAWMSPAARRCGEAVAQGRAAPPAVLERSRAHDEAFVLAPGHDGGLVARFAALDGALAPAGSPRGEEHAALPAIAADPAYVPALDAFIASHGVWVDPDALALLAPLREQHAHAAGLVALSRAHDNDLEVAGLGGELKPFQRAGVAYLLERRRAFLADEQGLGKTIQALAALEADGAYPAVVVCPASVKLGWDRELARWLPGRRARVLCGRDRLRGEDGAADVTIVNYDVLDRRLEELAALAPRALVLDESHMCKNGSARRTQAAQRLAAAVAPDGLVLALTGTPITNRPAELSSQLRILGRLEEFGSGAQLARRFRGTDAHVRLHWHLRARCLVRRLKADVLPQLPAKTRAVVPIELENEAEYRLAERDVVAWLQTQPLDLRELDARVAAALRAERLVRLNALKLLAARGKLRAALAWVHDFCRGGQPLVVFARHREVQRALVERFPQALHVLGDDTLQARDAAVQTFQGAAAEEHQLIVCSLEAAGHGLTLTRASNVAFLELDWTPARHDQAEDRCHRIGQRDAVTAHYLLAADTIDETIAMLLERKRAVIAAVTDGREDAGDGVVGALVRELRGTPYRHLRAVA